MIRFKRIPGRKLIQMLRDESLGPDDHLAIQRELSMRKGVRHSFSGRKPNNHVFQRTVGGDHGGDFMPAELEYPRSVKGQVELSRKEKRRLKQEGKLSWSHPKALSPSQRALNLAEKLLSPHQHKLPKPHKATVHDVLGSMESNRKLASYLSSGVPSFKTVGDDDADVSQRKPVKVKEKQRKDIRARV